jgi:glycosyltransferase involved in cell wall biosynthesis
VSRVVIVHVAHWEQLLGGAELQLSYLAEYYRDRGNEVHVVYVNRNNRVISNEKSLVLHPINEIKTWGVIGKSWFLLAKKVVSMLKSIDPDLLVTRARSSFAGLCASYASNNGKKHKHFVASDAELISPIKVKSFYRLFDHLEWVMYKKVFGCGSELICQNSYQSSYLLTHYSLQAKIMTQVAVEPEQDNFYKPEAYVRVVWVANLKTLKRPELFIKISKMLCHRSDIKFTMIGGDPSGEYNELLATTRDMDNFEYLGQLSNDDVNKVLCSSHVLINTSDYEGFSNTFVQAWLREVVVLSLNSNPDEILTNQNIGYVTGDIETTVNILERFLDNREVMNDKAFRSREYALKNHTLRSV